VTAVHWALKHTLLFALAAFSEWAMLDSNQRPRRVSVYNNTVAYGFSIVITAALALVQAGRDTADLWEVLTFAGGAVLAFTIRRRDFLYLALGHRLEEDSTEVSC
jgi:hypothetical protein